MAMATVSAQPGELRGRITDATTGGGLPYANVAIMKSGAIITGASADSLGYYRIKPLEAGTYTVRGSYVLYKATEVNGVSVSSGRIAYLDISLDNDNTLPPVVIKPPPPRLIEKDETITMHVIDQVQIELAAAPELRALVARAPGVVQPRDNGPIYIRGSRPDATQYIVNGVRSRDGVELPRGSIAGIEVLTGGIPASFGDATGGFVVITTKSYRQN